jgi:hypothetical protein
MLLAKGQMQLPTGSVALVQLLDGGVAPTQPTAYPIEKYLVIGLGQTQSIVSLHHFVPTIPDQV